MKTIDEIELNYIREIIQYFCVEYIKWIKFNGSEYQQHELKHLISRQIDNRLIHTHLLINYKLEINVYPLSEKRNVKIQNVIDGGDNFLQDNITIFYETRNRTIGELKFNL